jgi:hypothetical protein
MGFVSLALAYLVGPVAAQSPAAFGVEDTHLPNEVGPAVLRSSPIPIVNRSVAVTTYHYDTLRTGWNNHETTLTATKFPSNFGILQTVTLDDQVDAQPLIAPGININGGKHDLVIVATESNTIYAIDASTGVILNSKNLGTAVPQPLGCTNGNVGIAGTPVIDLAKQVLYVVAYINGSPPTYQLHALKLFDFTDKLGSPVTVAESHNLTDGSTFTFDATYQQQRPALLLNNNVVYAAFGSFCDFRADKSRGWLLGWNANTLKPLLANQLDDRQATSQNDYFLNSIWMSGYGIAASGSNLYFTTGNSDYSGTAYDSVTNISESVVGLAGNLAKVLGHFTPPNVAQLEMDDTDVGSGGVLLFPTNSRKFPYLAAAAGKDGNLLLLNPASLSTPLDTQSLDGCWCGPSFFAGSDRIGRIVTSQGSTLQTWRVLLSPSPQLALEGTAKIDSGQDPGFFTVVSSNGTQAGTAIIWAVSRPTDNNPALVKLYAFDTRVNPDGSLNQIFFSPAGSWANIGSNENTVPVVANGKVYVASNSALTIFGIGGASVPKIPSQPNPVAAPGSLYLITGILQGISGSTLTLKTRTGKSVKIDDAQAVRNQRVGAPLRVGIPLTVQGSSIEGTGALQATSIVRAKGSTGELWPLDR